MYDCACTHAHIHVHIHTYIIDGTYVTKSITELSNKHNYHVYDIHSIKLDFRFFCNENLLSPACSLCIGMNVILNYLRI